MYHATKWNTKGCNSCNIDVLNPYFNLTSMVVTFQTRSDRLMLLGMNDVVCDNLKYNAICWTKLSKVD